MVITLNIEICKSLFNPHSYTLLMSFSNTDDLALMSSKIQTVQNCQDSLVLSYIFIRQVKKRVAWTLPTTTAPASSSRWKVLEQIHSAVFLNNDSSTHYNTFKCCACSLRRPHLDNQCSQSSEVPLSCCEQTQFFLLPQPPADMFYNI